MVALKFGIFATLVCALTTPFVSATRTQVKRQVVEENVCATVNLNLQVPVLGSVPILAGVCLCESGGVLNPSSQSLLNAAVSARVNTNILNLLGLPLSQVLINLQTAVIPLITGSPNKGTSCVSNVPVARRSLPRRCPTGYKGCAISNSASFSSSPFECIDTDSNLESCGGCIYPTGGDKAGEDCTEKVGVDFVTCVNGACVTKSCARGFTLTGTECIQVASQQTIYS